MKAKQSDRTRRRRLSFDQMVLRRRNFQWLIAHGGDDMAKAWAQAERMALFGKDASTPTSSD